DEWYGIANSSDEAFWTESSMYRPDSSPYAAPEYVVESTKGQTPTKVKLYNLAERRIIDRELTEKAKDFITREANAKKPFFAYVPYTMPHFPVTPAPEFDGKTGNGFWADALAQMDAYTGELIDTVDKLGIKDNTIFIFTSDNGPEMTEPWAGWAGPWRGTYFTGLEDSLRVPFIIAWPGKIPAGRVSNEIVHEMDLFPTIAAIVQGKIPTDRVIDGVDQGQFLMGKHDCLRQCHNGSSAGARGHARDPHLRLADGPDGDGAEFRHCLPRHGVDERSGDDREDPPGPFAPADYALPAARGRRTHAAVRRAQPRLDLLPPAALGTVVPGDCGHADRGRLDVRLWRPGAGPTVDADRDRLGLCHRVDDSHRSGEARLHPLHGAACSGDAAHGARNEPALTLH